MRKKLFTLMTLLLTAVTGAWAAADFTYALSTFTESPTGTYTATFSEAKWQNKSVWVEVPSASIEGTIAFQGSSDKSTRYLYIYKTNGTVKDDTRKVAMKSSSWESSTIAYTSSDILTDGGKYYLVFGTSDDFKAKGFKYTAVEEAVATSEVLKSSDAVKVGETTLTKDAGTAGYSVSSTTITLTDDQKTISKPSNIKLVKTVTYDDSSTKDKDVTVTFDGTVTDGYYIGTASIGLTGSEIVYTVRVKQNLQCENPVITPVDGSYFLGDSQTITMTSATDGVSIYYTTDGSTPTSSSSLYDGDSKPSISATTTIKAIAIKTGYSDSEVVSATITKFVKSSITPIGVKKVWDWTSWNQSLELTAVSVPSSSDELTYTDIAALTTLVIPSGFDGDALMFKGQYPNQGKRSQAGTWTFNTTIPGILIVDFADTGSSGSSKQRFLNVNGSNTTYYADRGAADDAHGKGGKTVTSGEIPVAAGNVVITGMESDGTTSVAIRIMKITFIPTLAMTEEATDFTPTALGVSNVTLTRTLSAGYYNSICLPFDVDLTDTDSPLYDADVQEFSSVDDTTLKFSAVSTTMVAGTPYLVKPTTDLVNPTFESVDVKAVAAGTVTKSNASSQEFSFKGTYNKVTLKTDKTEQFLNTSGTFSYPSSAGAATMKGLRAYFIVPAAIFGIGAPGMSIVFGDESSDDITTGISAIEHSTLNIELSEVYNLNGQRVSQPTKGLYIVNGKKVIVK